MVESGEEPEQAPIEYDPVAAQRAYEAGLSSFLTRVQGLRAEIERNNDLFVERRLASLKTSYSKNIQKQKELLVRAQASNRQERYLRLLKGTITRLESELTEKANDLEGQRAVEIDYDEIAAGGQVEQQAPGGRVPELDHVATARCQRGAIGTE